ncbi:MAG: hypothetical protein JWM08_1523 [Candidatus Angelobacter sp.]|nr:hypothetical protein [Candidatus Angelobacter sp.]
MSDGVKNNIQNNWNVKYCLPHNKGAPTARQSIAASVF